VKAKTTAGAKQVDSYLARLAAPQRETLEVVRERLRSILPHASEGMKYGMPVFSLSGKGIASYAGFKAHCGYFPHSSAVLGAAGRAVASYPVSKGGLQFPIGKPLPVALLRRLVKLRIAELADVTRGPRFDHYDDGQLKAAGPMKDGKLHGRWKWFRRDGTLMRTGQFAQGRPVGTWQTWNADGTLAKATKR
jgi:uncharacterized protein YdhG (YjbR/CyaY superfamily)